jgi:formylglycine-generating enzyme required for sulfatase activity
METEMARQVFISYASEDFAIADRVCRALENIASTCWMAPRDIPPGTDYPAAIVDGIREATVLVLILTDAAVQSPHILSEVGHAFNEKKRIIPFRISKVALPADLEYFLAMTQWLDAEAGPTGGNLKRLIEAVRAALRGTSIPVGPAPRSRVTVLTAALAVAVVLLGVGAAYWMHIKPNTISPAAEAPLKPAAEKEPPAPAKSPIAESKPTWVNPADGQTYVWILPGTFTMGCSAGDDQCGADEKPAHTVKIAAGFWLARTEVTIRAFRAHGSGGQRSGGQLPERPGDAQLPITEVTWEKAKKFCAAVGGRLPAESEWEYAARAGVTTQYYGELSEIAWYADNSGEVPHPVQTKAPNAFGLYDMLGNVGEWVLDRYYNRYYLDAPAVGPEIDQPLTPNASATARGGFFGGGSETVRVSRRVAIPPDEPSQAVGFRCVAQHPAP